MVPKKVLLLSYSFPPSGQSEASVAAKTMGGLKALGFEVTVISADPTAHGVRSEYSLIPYIESRFSEVHYLRPRNLFGNPIAIGLFKKWLPFIYGIPDRYRLTNSAAWKLVEKLPMEDFSAVVTRSQSHAIHLVGLKIKQRFPRLKWIAHFSDPWVDNPYVNQNRLISRLNLLEERRVIEAADHTVVTCTETLDLIFKKYPKEWLKKASVIPHPFDRSLYPQNVAEKKNKDHLVLSHLGHFYGPRSPLPFLKALRILQQTDPGLLQRVKIHFYGSLKDQRKVFSLVSKLPADLCHFHPPVDYLWSLKIMKESDGLILIDAAAEKSVFLPSKLIDYLGSEKPVFGITPPGPARSIIEKIDGSFADPNNPNEIAAAFRQFIFFLQNPNKIENQSSDHLDFRERFSVKTICQKVAQLLDDDLAAEQPHPESAFQTGNKPAHH